MQQLKCMNCGVVNLPGQTVCEGCGTALTAAPHVVHEQVAPSSTVVVDDRGMSDAAKILTGLFAIIGIVIVGVLFYQWGQASQSETELERARLDQSRSGSTSRPSTTAPAPVIVTTPTPSPTVITSTTPAGSQVPADNGVNAYKASMDPILRRWNDSILAAEAASGAQLESAITALREVERSTSMVSPPSSGARAHARLMTAMRTLIDEFTAAARKQTAVSNSTTYVESRKQFDEIAAEIEALNAL